MKGNQLLIIAAILNLLIAVLHIVIIFVGAPGYRYFGAGEEMARMDEAGSWQPAVLTLVVTLFFILFALYALAGAHKFRKLPFMKIVLIVIAVIFLLRGLGVIGDLYMMYAQPAYPSQMVWFSLVAFITGLCYAIGVRKNWTTLRA